MRSKLRRLVAVVGWASICVTPALSGRNASARELLLAEPIHHVGFLPVYVAHHKGYFKDEGIELKLGVFAAGAFVNAVLSGDAFAYISSVDHNAFARVNGKRLTAVSNLVARANIYMMARTDIPPMTGDLPSYLRGKRIAVSAYASTPNNVLRYFLKKWNLDPRKDVTLVEVANSSVVPASIKSKQTELGVAQEPLITQLYNQGLWTQPIFNAGKELGPFVDTAVTVRGDTVEKDPATVKAFVKAVVRGLGYVNDNRNEMLGFAKMEFPTATVEDLKASLDRAFADGIYSTDGFISKESWATGEAIVLEAGLLKQPVPYDEVIDMQFVNEVRKELKIP
jgi:NitT/TauT family transport system substrate-binding protein